LAFDPFLQIFNSLSRLQIPCALVTDSDPDFREGDDFYKTKKKPAKVDYDSKAEEEVAGDEILFPKTLINYGRAFLLEQMVNNTKSGARVFRNLKTFEYDLALTDYLKDMITVYKSMHPEKGVEMEESILKEFDGRKKAIRFFKAFSSKDKARFAQRLASLLEPEIDNHRANEKLDKGNDITLWSIYHEPPNYISNAIKWVTGGCLWV
jgi:hypothetical protein